MPARAPRSALLTIALVSASLAERAVATPRLPSRALAQAAGKPAEKPDPKSAATKAADPKPAPEESKPVFDLAELAKTVTDKNAVAALGWLEFMGRGYKGAADHVGQGAAADAELALGGAVEKVVQALFPTLVGKKGKVKLNDAVEAPVVKLADDGIVVTVGKNEEKTVAWRELDPAKLAVLLIRNKPTADEELAAIATLKLIAGDPGDARKSSTKLTSEFGKKLGEIVESFKAVGPEIKAARTLDSILHEKDDAAFLDRMKKGWSDAKDTALGRDLAPKVREQFVLRGEKGYAGEPSIKSAIHGKVTLDPKKAHPMAGAGAVWIEVEYEFDKDSEATDFDPARAPTSLRALLTRVERKRSDPEPFRADRSRLVGTGSSLGCFPLAFLGNLEVNAVGGIVEEPKGHEIGAILFGAAGDDGDAGTRQVIVEAFSQVSAWGDDRAKPAGSALFKMDKVRPGEQFDALLRVTGNRIVLARNGENSDPITCPTDKPLRPFVLATSDSQWFVERVVIRGTVPQSSLRELGHDLAEREAKQLFGG